MLCTLRIGRYCNSSYERRTASFSEGILDPLDVRRRATDQHGIETARRNAAAAGEIMMRRRYEPPALDGGNALGRAAKALRAALAYFDEHQCRTVARDEVYFAEATAIIAFGDDQSVPAQERGGERFRGFAPAVHCLPAKISSFPSANWAPVSWRTNR